MKKISSFFLAVIISCSFIAPIFATSEITEYDVNPDLEEAYIEFSRNLYELNITVNTCYEDFVTNYNSALESVDMYIDRMTDAEISMAQSICNNLSSEVKEEDLAYISAVEARNDGQISTEEESRLQNYENLMRSFDEAGYQIYFPYSSFIEVHNSGEVYVQPRSVTSKWYDNIGDNKNSPKLSEAANYSKYNLLSVVKKGDIVQETDGGIAYYSGHIAIIQGKYYDLGYGQFYLRTIEAGISGVVYGAFDDSRYDYRGINVYHVTDATDEQKKDAVNFCVDQLGKAYDLSAVLWETGECKYSTDSKQWYCSELVWAAYYNQGINLYGTSIPKHVYMPIVMAGSSKLTKRTIG